MPTPPISDDQLSQTLETLRRNGGSVNATAKALSMARGSVQYRIRVARERGLLSEGVVERWREEGPPWELPALPSGETPEEELLEKRRRTSRRKLKHFEASQLIDVKMNVPGPFAIAFFGDLHLDDDGCDFDRLERHMNVVKRTPGLFAASVGDLQNSWIGRLSRLWAEQETSAREAWVLVQWWIRELGDKLLFIVEGNHDCWAHNVNGVSPLEWLQQGPAAWLREVDGIRIKLSLPGTEWAPVINCRHDYKGSSVWHHGHGPLKAARLGLRDDLYIAGHRHVASYTPILDPIERKIIHPLRVASYKKVDAYAKKIDAEAADLWECPVVIFDPDEPDPRYRIVVMPEPEKGAAVLRTLQQRGVWHSS